MAHTPAYTTSRHVGLREANHLTRAILSSQDASPVLQDAAFALLGWLTAMATPEGPSQWHKDALAEMEERVLPTTF